MSYSTLFHYLHLFEIFHLIFGYQDQFLLSFSKISVVFPRTGIEDGQTIRMPVGQKELFVTFRVEKSDYFKRDGFDVHTSADISISQAVLGGTIRIQGLYEDHTLQVSYILLKLLVLPLFVSYLVVPICQ